VVKEVAEVVGAVVNAAVRNVEHATTMAMRAAPSALPLDATMIVQISEIAEVAGPGTATSTAGSRAGSTVLCAGGSIASTNSQCSGSERKSRDHSDGLLFSSKRRTSSGDNDVHPDALQARDSSCPAADLPNQLSELAARVSSPNPKSVQIFQVKCLGQSSEPPS
jgi:hypothetical protein